MPSKAGEFYPATGRMADGRDNLWIAGSTIVSVIIRDLSLYINDIREVASQLCDQKLNDLVEEVCIVRSGYIRSYADIYHHQFGYDDLRCISLRTPMNPLEEAVGMMYRIWAWIGDYDSNERMRSLSSMSKKYSAELDELNDRFWERVDRLESISDSSSPTIL